MGTSFETILYERDDRVLRITLNRPSKANALNPKMLSELTEAFDRANEEEGVCCIVLTGAGEKAFCAGADLGGMSQGQRTFLEVHEARGLFPNLFRAILNHAKPTLAAVNGHCVAGGMGLMLACDLAIAKQGVKFGTPEIARGLFPFMISALILRTVSRRDAYRMMLLGETFEATRAEEMGLINETASQEDFPQRVESWASRLSSFSPAVLKLGRRSLLQQEGMPLDAAFSHLQGLISINAMLDDAKEGIDAFFEKREPIFKGR